MGIHSIQWLCNGQLMLIAFLRPYMQLDYSASFSKKKKMKNSTRSACAIHYVNLHLNVSLKCEVAILFQTELQMKKVQEAPLQSIQSCYEN